MRKTLIRISSCILSLVAFLGIVGCKEKDNSIEDNTNSEIEEDTKKETEHYFIKDGGSPYKIVLNDDVLYEEKFASEEIVSFVNESANVLLPVVSSKNVTYSKDSHLIVLGDALKEYSPIKDETLTSQFYHIKTVDSNVFITGGDALGTLYGAYDFLHNEIDYEFYEQDCIYVKKDVKELKLFDMDITDGPDILYRHPHYGPVNKFKNCHRYRMSYQPWIKGRANYVHNVIPEYFPYDQYKESHPEYYSSTANGDFDGTQICYSGHGNPDTLKEMQDIVINRIKELVNIEYNKGHFAESISFTHMDMPNWCRCETCSKSKEKYGTDAAIMIHFVNPVAREIKKWMAETWPGHNLTIAIFAYVATEDAPVDKVGDKYIPIDDTVYLEDNVALFYAPFYMDYCYDFDHKTNIKDKETLEKWSTISKKFYLWTYSLYTHDYLLWHDSFNSMQSIYKKAKELNTIMLFDQARYNTDALTGFDRLKMYLNAKLMWNVDDDYNTLIQNYFDNYFLEGSKAMKTFFDEYRTWMEYLRSKGMVSGILNKMPNKEQYPKNILEGWSKYIKQALKDIEVIKDRNIDEYNMVYDRIRIENMAIDFHLILFYEDTYPTEIVKEMKKNFKKEAKKYGFTKYQEHKSLDAIIGDW